MKDQWRTDCKKSSLKGKAKNVCLCVRARVQRDRCRSRIEKCDGTPRGSGRGACHRIGSCLRGLKFNQNCIKYTASIFKNPRYQERNLRRRRWCTVDTYWACLKFHLLAHNWTEICKTPFNSRGTNTSFNRRTPLNRETCTAKVHSLV